MKTQRSAKRDLATRKRKHLLRKLAVPGGKPKFDRRTRSRRKLSNTASKYACFIVNTIQASRNFEKSGDNLSGKKARKIFPSEFTRMPVWVKQSWSLTAFSSAVADDWFEVGWKAILELTGGHPEKSAELATLGTHPGKHLPGRRPKKETTDFKMKANLLVR